MIFSNKRSQFYDGYSKTVLVVNEVMKLITTLPLDSIQR